MWSNVSKTGGTAEDHFAIADEERDCGGKGVFFIQSSPYQIGHFVYL